MGGAGVRWVLRCVVLGLWPSVRVLETLMHPRWGTGLSDAGATAATLSGLVLIRVRRVGRCARHAASRPAALKRITLRQALWCGFPAGLLIAAVSITELPECQALFNAGGCLAITCPCGLILRWGFAERLRRRTEKQQQGAQVRLLADPVLMRVDQIEKEVSGIRRGIMAAFEHSGDGEVPAEDGLRKRHMYLVQAGETGPQRAVLGAPLARAAVAVALHRLG